MAAPGSASWRRCAQDAEGDSASHSSHSRVALLPLPPRSGGRLGGGRLRSRRTPPRASRAPPSQPSPASGGRGKSIAHSALRTPHAHQPPTPNYHPTTRHNAPPAPPATHLTSATPAPRKAALL